MRAALRGIVLPLLLLAPAGCELTEVTLADTEELVVVEALVQVTPLFPTHTFRVRDAAWVLLHRAGEGERADREVPGARVTITVGDPGETFVLPEQTGAEPAEPCVVLEDAEAGPSGNAGTCYGMLTDLGVRPGDRLELLVELPDGGEIRGATTVPSGFGLLGPRADVTCWLPPGETVEVRWTAAPDAWAYIAEVTISGLRNALAGSGIPVERDPLGLLGLAISARDTTIVLPTELGVFDRFDLDRDLAVLLQEGFPAPTDVVMAVAAVDRNYVNWLRGGNFNPSGLVRVPSVTGDGTGFFGSSVVQAFTARVRDERPAGAQALPDCRGDRGDGR